MKTYADSKMMKIMMMMMMSSLFYSIIDYNKVRASFEGWKLARGVWVRPQGLLFVKRIKVRERAADYRGQRKEVLWIQH